MRQVLIESGINYVEVANEAAFYGPKIDVQVWSVIGREFTLATNQVDFAVPAKFGLTYRDKDNSNKTPLCIHRAPLGTHERFIGFLIESRACGTGNFPLHRNAGQAGFRAGSGARHHAQRRRSVDRLRQAHRGRTAREHGARGCGFQRDAVQGEDCQCGTIARPSRNAGLVIGGRDMDAGAVSVRLHHGGPQGAKPKAEVVADILASIRERRA
jgi:threonyl-tRNA synthetase